MLKISNFLSLRPTSRNPSASKQNHGLRLKAAMTSLLLLFLIFTTTSHADTEQDQYVTAKFVDEAQKFGIKITPAPGWHFYYKEAGDAGYATEFNFSRAAEVTYPPYEVIDEYGFKVNAYKKATFFPVEAEGNKPLNVTINGAVCHEICVPFEIKLEHTPGTGSGHSLTIGLLLTAMLAGLILNIMPCVLPVLSIKILSLLKHKKTSFLSTAAGIIFSFLILAGLAIALKNAGMAIGWGLHFQSPYFVGVLMVITLLFAASLFGLFHLNPPKWAHNIGGSNFASGVLATILGTSCTAPVLVTAVGFALSGNSLDILAMFFMMGIGMALPFLLLAAFPKTAQKILPKPGAWMLWVKRIMGVLLLGTAIWLGFVLYSSLMPKQQIEYTEGGIWQKFSEDKLADLVADHNLVLVDITAKWCVNCKANKLAVTETAEMLAYFKAQKVVLLQGDMTKASPDLFNYIKSFGVYGIPVNVVYGPGKPDGILLPPLLTKSAVKEAIEQAK